MNRHRARTQSSAHRTACAAPGESLLEVLVALWIVAVLVLELARVEIQQLHLRQALDLRLRAAHVLDTFAETRQAVGTADDGNANRPTAIDWAARTAYALPGGRIAVNAVAGGAIRVEVSWRRATRGEVPVPARPGPDAGLSAAAACTVVGGQRDCLAIVLPDRPAPRSALPDVPLPPSASFTSLVPPTLAASLVPLDPLDRLDPLAAFAASPASGPASLSVGPLARHSARAAGHSLLELLIAAVLGGMVVTVALSAYQVRRDSQARRVDDARMRMDAQAAIDLLQAYARLAGYGLSFAAGTSTSLPAVVSCPAGARPRLSCLPSVPGSDGLVIHYRADAVSASKSAQTRQLLDCGGRLLPSRGAVTAARIAVLKDRTHDLPRLHCRGLGQGGGDPLVEGVERLQIRYWVTGRDEPLAANALGDDALAIRGLQFCVTVRGQIRRPRRDGAATAMYRDCDGRWQSVATDGYARRTATLTVALRNVGSPGNAGNVGNAGRETQEPDRGAGDPS